MKGLGFILIKFQSLDVMYFPIFEGCECSVCLFLPRSG
jgi:hypothetical protein